MNDQIIKKPVISEKSFTQAAAGIYVFQVARNSNKQMIVQQIEKLFKVKVAEVNIVNISGKVKGAGKKIGTRSNVKKAYVKIKKGQKINIFEAEEKENKKVQNSKIKDESKGSK